MSKAALYVYGVVRFGVDLNWLDWSEKGIAEKDVYIIGERKFGAVVHECEEEPYPTEDPQQIKEMIIAHNRILDQALENFAGMIPVPFNTIIKNGTAGTNSARLNLIKWLNDDQEKLETIWNKVKGKKEYGIKIYYDQEKLLQEASEHQDIKNMEKSYAGTGAGLSYLLRSQAQAKTQEIFHEKANKLRQEFYGEIKKITEEVVINPSPLSLEEEKDLLLKLSILIAEQQLGEIKEFLKQRTRDYSYHLAGPFAPYSFVENDEKQ